MSPGSTTNIHLDAKSDERLRHIAERRKRSPRVLLLEAVEQYLDREERRASFLADAVDAWENYQSTGLHVTDDEADQWLAELEGGKDVEPPKCHA
ncbi:MAG: CopG family ribbon-helix-helix protein [Rhizobiaceae bacterium]